MMTNNWSDSFLQIERGDQKFLISYYSAFVGTYIDCIKNKCFWRLNWRTEVVVSKIQAPV